MRVGVGIETAGALLEREFGFMALLVHVRGVVVGLETAGMRCEPSVQGSSWLALLSLCFCFLWLSLLVHVRGVGVGFETAGARCEPRCARFFLTLRSLCFCFFVRRLSF